MIQQECQVPVPSLELGLELLKRTWDIQTAVNRRLLLSPGKMSSSQETPLDRQTRRLRAMRRSLKGKQRRLQLKARNIVSNASSKMTRRCHIRVKLEPSSWK